MKNEQEIIAAYKVAPLDLQSYEITTLQVLKDYRGMGIGSWLLAHAVGVIETKGGRLVTVRWPTNSFLSRFGFREMGANELCYEIIQE